MTTDPYNKSIWSSVSSLCIVIGVFFHLAYLHCKRGIESLNWLWYLRDFVPLFCCSCSVAEIPPYALVCRVLTCPIASLFVCLKEMFTYQKYLLTFSVLTWNSKIEPVDVCFDQSWASSGSWHGLSIRHLPAWLLSSRSSHSHQQEKAQSDGYWRGRQDQQAGKHSLFCALAGPYAGLKISAPKSLAC